ncbi:MAG: hypothetical protein GF398_21025 [Chitinivibrionales bacterium]|nr:hypothetical protein [Chitinivibrionales bacterium]
MRIIILIITLLISLRCSSDESLYPRINPYDPDGAYYQPATIAIFPKDTTVAVGDTITFVAALADEYEVVERIVWEKDGVRLEADSMQQVVRVGFGETNKSQIVIIAINFAGLRASSDTALVTNE